MNLLFSLLIVEVADNPKEAVFSAMGKLLLIPVLVLFLLAFVIRIVLYIRNQRKEKKEREMKGRDPDEWRNRWR